MVTLSRLTVIVVAEVRRLVLREGHTAVSANKILCLHCVYKNYVWSQTATEDTRNLVELLFSYKTFCMTCCTELTSFLSILFLLKRKKFIGFWFQTMKNDWVWRKVFERFITIPSVSVNFIFSTGINIREAWLSLNN